MLNVDDLETGVVFFEKGIFHVPKEGFVSWQCDGLMMLSSIRFAKHGKVTLVCFSIHGYTCSFQTIVSC